MKFDVVEREFYILGADFDRLAKSFRSLAMALRQERESGRVAPSRSDEAPGPQDKDRPFESQTDLPFPI